MGMHTLYLLATASSEGSDDLLSKLGIDGWTLLFQIIAFLILVFALSKWVYPIFIGIIDKREADIAASAKAATDARKAADDASAEVAELLSEARREASEIVATAKVEANAAITAAEAKAKAKSESIVAAARDDIEKEVTDARKTLHNDVIDLVTAATEKVVGVAVAKKDIDQKLIAQAVKEGAK